MECLEPASIKFDFLGKDSVPYENTVEVKPQVFRNVRRWIKKDAAGSSALLTGPCFEPTISLYPYPHRTSCPRLWLPKRRRLPCWPRSRLSLDCCTSTWPFPTST